MENTILGLHHITAIAGNAQQNFDFYTKTLGLRLVKKTVNFDDPGTYHLYYGDEAGHAGTILTFFPWDGIGQGTEGVGMATEIGYAVPEDSLAFWKDRFEQAKIKTGEITERFGEQLLTFKDPDGLSLSLIIPGAQDLRKPWETSEVTAENATKGFHSTTLNLQSININRYFWLSFVETRRQPLPFHHRCSTDGLNSRFAGKPRWKQREKCSRNQSPCGVPCRK